jgi:hypothetical protein
MIQNLTIPRLQKACKEVNECFPQAKVVIAGGAVRDVLNGKPVKDIDTFIQLDPSLPEEKLYEAWYTGCVELASRYYCDWSGDFAGRHDKGILADGEPLEQLSNRAGYGYGAFSLVDFPTGPFMHPWQLVFIDIDPEENVRHHFDFGLSQCWVTPEQLRMTSAYWQDHFRRRITYTPSREPNEQRLESSRGRLERLREKYADWEFHRMHLLGRKPEPVELVEPLMIGAPRQSGKSYTWETYAAQQKLLKALARKGTVKGNWDAP